MKLRRRTPKPTLVEADPRGQQSARRRRRRALRTRPKRRAAAAASTMPDRERPPPSIRWRLPSEPDQPEEDAPETLGVGSLMITPQMREEEEARQAEAAIPGPPGPDASAADIAEQIRALEARLDGMLERAHDSDEDQHIPPSIREQVGSAAREVVERLAAPLPELERPGSDDGTVVDAARELLSSNYYLRQWGRIGMRNRSEEVDEFGYDPTYERRFLPAIEFLYKRYFRVKTAGLENVPEQGRCLIVANHSGTIPLDGLMLRMALSSERPDGGPVRWLAEDYLYYLPFAGSFITRVGAVRACQENAERLLDQECTVAAFPEGVKGIRKLFKERYRLQRFGRGGFIRLALRTQTPIVPCAIVGAEETGPMLQRLEHLGQLFGLPYIPVTPTFPWLGPLGLVPAPTKWHIVFGDVVSLDSYGREAADDDVLVGRLTERVRASIQSMLDDALRSRKSVWWG